MFMFIVESETNNDVVIEQTLERFSRYSELSVMAFPIGKIVKIYNFSSSSSVKKTWSYICAFNCVSDSKTRMDPILSHDLNPSNYEGEQVRRIETCK